ncbi:methylated-DNA--[protein]-cysteine S-methyltransferase [Luteimonas sp. 22616]|uniref:methylated-DNA--[protein]-cysteine S-methyltransferase n=1 Tax=Luteimonas sp. 22616 TaxID=3453951 RepID=UPI003F84C200
MNLVSKHIPSPVGPLLLGADDDHLRLIWFSTPRHPLPRNVVLEHGDNAVLRETGAQLEAYFTGSLHAFDLPLQPVGTKFQREVWSTLAQIPYGQTWSYSDVARRIGKPQAVRAVGAANGRNPIPIVLPCHRVIGADGSLTGFGGGLPTKQFLLMLEGALPSGDLFAQRDPPPS